MEKFYIVEKDSSVFKDYEEYEKMSFDVNEAFKEFAQEVGIETSEYYQLTDSLKIVPSTKDVENFGQHFKKNDKGDFKMTSPMSKQWVKKCTKLGLRTPRRPHLGIVFNVCGRTQSRLFKQDDILYATFRSELDFTDPEGFKEIKASEFYKIIEDAGLKLA